MEGGFKESSRLTDIGTVSIAAAAGWEHGALHAAGVCVCVCVCPCRCMCDQSLTAPQSLTVESNSTSFCLWHSDHRKASNKNQMTKLMRAHDDSITCVGMSESGEFLATGDGRGHVKVWRTAILASDIPSTGKPSAALVCVLENNKTENSQMVGKHSVTKLVFVGKEDNTKLVVMRKNGSLEVHEFLRGSFSKTEEKMDLQDFNNGAFEVFFINKATEKTNHTLIPTEPEKNVRNRIDGGWYFMYGSSSGDFSLKIHHLGEDRSPNFSQPQKTGSVTQQLKGHNAGVTSAAYAIVLEPQFEGKYPYIFTGSADKTIRVWSAINWSCKFVLRGHSSGIAGILVPSATITGPTTDEVNTHSRVSMWFLSVDEKGELLIW